MKNCPHCKKISQSDDECDWCGRQFKDGKRNTDGMPKVDLDCPFNDHGQICGKRGSISPSTNGSGPWYCSRHFWILQGFTRYASEPQRPTLAQSDAEHLSEAKQYCADRGLDTQAKQMDFIRHTIKHGKIGKGGSKPMREPGEDEDFILGTQP